MFNLANLSPLTLGRVNKALDKLYSFSGKVMSLRAFIESHPNGKKKITDSSFKFNRHKFNRMDGAQQRKYEESLKKECYNFVYRDSVMIGIPKIVYDVLNVPEDK